MSFLRRTSKKLLSETQNICVCVWSLSLIWSMKVLGILPMSRRFSGLSYRTILQSQRSLVTTAHTICLPAAWWLEVLKKTKVMGPIPELAHDILSQQISCLASLTLLYLGAVIGTHGTQQKKKSVHMCVGSGYTRLLILLLGLQVCVYWALIM